MTRFRLVSAVIIAVAMCALVGGLFGPSLLATDDKEGRRKHKLQTETLQAKRNRETGLANAESAWNEFTSALAQEHDALSALEATAQSAFKGYRKFRRLLARPQSMAEPDLSRDEYQLMSELR